MLKEDSHCRVCGYLLSTPPWGDDGHSPSWEICPCCGTEFGYEDCTPTSARKKREAWILDGKKWFHVKMKPESWDFYNQLKEIPDDFK
ncbi:hypothetical protein ABE501_20175 [Comamonas testosteroni]